MTSQQYTPLSIIASPLVLTTTLLATTANAFVPDWYYHYHHHNGHCSIHSLPFSPPILTTKTLTSSITTLFSSQNIRQGWDDTNNTNKHLTSSSTYIPSSSSIGDVVQNLHGGKYQFSETQYLAGGSVAGRQFAESLYSSCDNDDDNDGNGDNEEDLPRWAMRLQDPTTTSAAAELAVMDELKFDNEHKMHSIVIKNEERSWERYYAFLLPNNHDDNKNKRKGVVSSSSGSGDSCFRVSPSTGSLAPRGGASNVCDMTKPYSDSAIISIEWNVGVAVEGVGGDDDRKNNDWLLVVGTEAQVWKYRLSIV